VDQPIEAEKAVMQPFIRGSGLWHFYLQDHEVANKHLAVFEE
jgi:hypothetical protein